MFFENTSSTIMFISGVARNGNDVTDGISSVNSAVPISGGMAGDNGGFQETFVFDNNYISNSGAVSASLNSKTLKVATDYHLNWQAIGKVMTVTKVNKNRLFELDGIPIVDVYRKYLGNVIADGLPLSASEFPLIKIESNMEVCRVFFLKLEDNSLISIGNFEVGEKVRFAYGNAEAIVNETINNIEKYEGFLPEVMFNYSCGGRLALLQSSIYAELEPFNNIAPTVGFFACGEIMHKNNCNYFLNSTLTILSLSENSDEKNYMSKSNVDIQKTVENAYVDKRFSVLNALSYLSNAVISDLEASYNELASTIHELKNAQDKLVNSEKMAAVGGMVQGVAHELNTPIGLSITGISHIKSQTDNILQLLASGQMKRSDLDYYLDTNNNVAKSIMLGLDRAANLIKSFKLISSEQHQELMQVFDVKSNLNDILDSIRLSLKDKIKITIINNIEENIQFYSFPGIFYQIYTNLINNAVLHAFEGSDTGEITISGTLRKEVLIMAVTDNGKGMDAETIKKVFEPFFTTKRANGGTGLGMNIIYNLVNDKLLGSIHIESKEGVGTTIHIKVPDLTVSQS